MAGIPKCGVDLLMDLEELKLKAYQDPAGIWTIGYGHTVGVKPGMVWTEAQAQQELIRDCGFFWRVIEDMVKAPIGYHQGGALLAFVFNIGNSAFMKSTLLRELNSGLYAAVPEQIKLWNKITVNGEKFESKGLNNRRTKEVALWLTPDKDPKT